MRNLAPVWRQTRIRPIQPIAAQYQEDPVNRAGGGPLAAYCWPGGRLSGI